MHSPTVFNLFYAAMIEGIPDQSPAPSPQNISIENNLSGRCRPRSQREKETRLNWGGWNRKKIGGWREGDRITIVCLEFSFFPKKKNLPINGLLARAPCPLPKINKWKRLSTIRGGKHNGASSAQQQQQQQPTTTISAMQIKERNWCSLFPKLNLFHPLPLPPLFRPFIALCWHCRVHSGGVLPLHQKGERDLIVIY